MQESKIGPDLEKDRSNPETLEELRARTPMLATSHRELVNAQRAWGKHAAYRPHQGLRERTRRLAQMNKSKEQSK